MLLKAIFPMTKTFVYYFQINKYFSCSHNVIDSNWTQISVYNKNNYAFENLVPNTQYVFKVEPMTKNYVYHTNENMIYAKTTATSKRLTN